ncbi:helix-turn-helix domain-containing protein, partial [Nostoc sp.]
MIGRQKTYRVQLTEEEKKLLQQQALARKTGQSKARRAKIIIKVEENPDWTDAQIAGEIGCSSGLVRKWRKRWCQTRSLEEAPRPGRPCLFQAIVKAQATAFALRVAAGIACSKPTDFDIPLAR